MRARVLSVLCRALPHGDPSPLRRDPAPTPKSRDMLRWLPASLRGSRAIDLPIRVTLLFSAVMSVMPWGYESNEPAYVVLEWAAAALTVAAGWFPLWVAVLSVMGDAIFVAIYPENLQPFMMTITAAAAVIVSRCDFRRLAACVAAFMCSAALAFFAGSEDSRGIVFFTDVSVLGISIFMGLVAAYLQWYIEQEADARYREMEQHRGELEDMRHSLAMETHDTISYTLTRQGFMLRTLLRSETSDESRRILSELQLLTMRAQHQLRHRLLELDPSRSANTAGNPEKPIGDLEQALQKCADEIIDAWNAAGLNGAAEVRSVPATVPADVVDELELLVFELATNVLKHADSRGSCAIQVQGDTSSAPPSLVVQTTNSVPDGRELEFCPQSVSRRARALSGECEVRSAGERTVNVMVTIPLGSHVPLSIPAGRGLKETEV